MRQPHALTRVTLRRSLQQRCARALACAGSSASRWTQSVALRNAHAHRPLATTAMAQRGTQRARDTTTSTTAVAASARTATEALVAPLVQLWNAAEHAKTRLRLPRALELYERALALADASELLLHSTLLTAAMLYAVIGTRMALLTAGGADLPAAARTRGGEQLLRLSQRCLGLLRDRWRAGTLLTPTPEEEYFAEYLDRVAASMGVDSFVAWAYDALFFWPRASMSPMLTAEADCLHAMHEALCAAVEMRTRGLSCEETTINLLDDVLRITLDAAGPWLPRLRDTCGLSHADEAKLRKLQQEVAQGQSARREQIHNNFIAIGARGAADVAHHGLRSCTLPTCDATEAYPKTYKLCGRCRGAAYCCAAHSKEDWKRHKREDGCEAPA